MATFVTKERDPGSATVRDTKGETESGGSTWRGGGEGHPQDMAFEWKTGFCTPRFKSGKHHIVMIKTAVLVFIGQ